MKGQSIDDKRHKRLGYHANNGGFQHIYGGKFRFGNRLDSQLDITKNNAKVFLVNIPETDTKTDKIEEEHRLIKEDEIK